MTAFKCPGSIGTFKWVVMQFGLKNAKAMYQWAMNAIYDMIGHFLEIYNDGVVVKSNTNDNYLANSEKAFQMMQLHQLKMNPLKLVRS